ncbi:MAG: hypothetical protein ACOYJG_02380 [Prevotella sp.]|jgi:hypothetical protein
MRYLHPVFLLVVLLALSACSQPSGVKRSMYYWRTSLQLSQEEREFLRLHHVTRLYVRYFDVVNEESDGNQPNATLTFDDSLPKGVEIVPTVYILNDCMRHDDPLLAERILKRVRQMNETHDVGKLKELQIDCDWTMQTRQRFFAFLKQLRDLCHQNDVQLSVTIRLHQLSQPVPPADRGVLMVYNTGDVTQLSNEKPILNLDDVKPYVHYIDDYELPLSAAYPLFTWRVLFRGGRYVGILHGDDLPILRGDSIVTRQPSLQDILEAERVIGKRRPDAHSELILYDLSKQNIQKFHSSDYEKIFSAR